MEVGSVLEYLSAVFGILGQSYTLENIRRVDADSPGAVPFRTNPDHVARAKARRAWYRGQPVDEDLIPKVFRKDTGYREKDLILDARRRAYLVSGDLPPYDSMDQWLFLMQHHGLATRLLDWTENPLFGLYFAVQTDLKPKAISPVVWMMNPHVLNWKCYGCSIIPTTDEGDAVESVTNGIRTVDIGYGFKRFEAIFNPAVAKDPPMAIQPRVVDLRMSVQRSYFTVHGSRREGLNEQLAGTDMEKLGFLVKIGIRAAQVGSIREELLSCGVGHASLFPDLDGLFAEVNATHRTPTRGGLAIGEPDVGDTQAITGGGGSGVVSVSTTSR